MIKLGNNACMLRRLCSISIRQFLMSRKKLILIIVNVIIKFRIRPKFLSDIIKVNSKSIKKLKITKQKVLMNERQAENHLYKKIHN